MQNTQKVITGSVQDEQGNPVIAVVIHVKGTDTNAVTGIDGTFEIRAASDAVLEVRSLGYLTQEIAVNNKQILTIILQEDNVLLNEVVVVGYGTIKRANLSGAVSTVDSKIFESRPVQNAAAALQGEMPGVLITRSGGTPGGEDINIRVRDISSINGGSPLVLIDGAEGSLNSINPADIATISVLKDGNAAIYGARAADGVILVTTKSGRKNQALKVSLDAYYAFRKPALLKKTVNLYQYAEMGLEITDGSWTPEYTREDLPKIAANSPEVIPNGIWGEYPKFFQSVDWRDELVGNGNMESYNISMSGGGQSYDYLVSLGYQNENGLPKYGKDNNKRYFVRAKSNIELSRNVNFDLNLSYDVSDRDYSTQIDGRAGVVGNLWESMFKMKCWAPVYNPAGGYYTFQYYSNLAQALEEMGTKQTSNTNATLNGKLNWKVLDELTLTGQAIVRKTDADITAIYRTVDWYDWDNQQFGSYNTPNWADRSYGKSLYRNFTAYLDYKKKFGGSHNLGIMAGTSHESSDYDYFYAARQDFSQQELFSLQLGSPENQVATSSGEAWTINSFFARLNYTFKERYILEANFRGDGSSRFAPGYRWGYFPGASAAWRISEEPFIKQMNIFDNLKLRASYGEMGNQSGIGLYDYIQLITISGSTYPFGDGYKGQLAYPQNMTSLTRTWEKVTSANLGLDLAVLNSRLTGSVEYFRKQNRNMLIPVTYPSVLGTTAPYTNNRRLDVHGWEVSIGWSDKVNEFSYAVRLSVSDSKNKVVEKGGSDSFNLGLNTTRKGYPINSYFGYAFDGIIQDEADLEAYKQRFPNGGIPGNLAVGDAKYKDLDNDGKLSLYNEDGSGAGDAVYLGDQNPRYSFGFNFNAAYKGFDLGVFLQGIGKRTIFLEGEASVPFHQWWWEPLEYWHGRTWTPDRPDARYPAVTLADKRFYNYQVSTNTKFNAAYLRMKNIQVGYTLPAQLTQKANVEKIRLYVSGEDLFEIHHVPGGYDPENNGYFNNYPFTRNFSIGVNVTF